MKTYTAEKEGRAGREGGVGEVGGREGSCQLWENAMGTPRE